MNLSWLITKYKLSIISRKTLLFVFLTVNIKLLLAFDEKNTGDTLSNSNRNANQSKAYFIDSDNDGILDINDLDNDNDGILDTVEEAQCNANFTEKVFGPNLTLNPGFEFGNVNFISDSLFDGDCTTGAIGGPDTYFVVADGLNADNCNPNFNGISQEGGRFAIFDFPENIPNQNFWCQTITVNPNADYFFSAYFLNLIRDGVPGGIPVFGFSLTDNQSGTTVDLGRSDTLIDLSLNSNGWQEAGFNYTTLPGATTVTICLRNINFGIAGYDAGMDNVRFRRTFCDSDNDGIPNIYDLDSDNDGVYDIIEARNPNVIDANNDGVADGAVDVNGVPVSATGGTNPIDTDGAESPDYIDIDADNDGIQDNIEAQPTLNYLAPSGSDLNQNGVDDIYDMGANPITPVNTDGDANPDYLDLNSDNDCLTDNVEAYDLDQNGISDIIISGNDTDKDGLDDAYDTIVLAPTTSSTNPSDGNELPTNLPDNNIPGNDIDFREDYDLPNAGNNNTITVLPNSPLIDLFTLLGGMADTGGLWSPALDSGTSIYNPAIDPVGVYTYTVSAPTPCPPSIATITIIIQQNDCDNDGVQDNIDLDDDNDGILDTDECDTINNILVTGFEVGEPLPTTCFGSPDVIPAFGVNNIFNGVNAIGLHPDLTDATAMFEVFTIQLQTPLVNGQNLTINLATANQSGSIAWQPNGTGFFNVYLSDVNCGLDQLLFKTSNRLVDTGWFVETLTATVNIPSGTFLTFVPFGVSNNPTIDQPFMTMDSLEIISSCPDFDFDGIPNSKDLDSDNDGISDVIESGGLDTNGDGLADDDDDNVDNTASNGIPTSSGNGAIPINTDNSDGFNFLDIDADNDGIQDNIEAQTTLNYVAPSGMDINQNGIDDIYDMGANPITPTDTDGDAQPDYLDLNSDNDCLEDAIEGYDTNGDGMANIMPSGNDTDNDGLDDAYDTIVLSLTTSITNPTDGNENPNSFPDLQNAGNDIDFREDFILPNPGTDGTLTICNSATPEDLFDNLGGTPDTGGFWTPALNSGTGVFDPNIDIAQTYTYTITSNNSCPEVSANVVVLISNEPNAGTNGTITLCDSSNTINLFDSLGGAPDSGGVWTPSLSSGSDIFDPSVDTAGTYTYTVMGMAPCSDNDTSTVLVNVNISPNAGEDNSIALCENSDSINLFDLLQGTPDAVGVWTPALSSNTGVFNPTIDLPGDYTYTVDALAPCIVDTAVITVTVNPEVNAGLNASLSICASATPLDLFTVLEGTPDPGGTWTPALASGTGLFNPAVDVSNTYTYTVNGIAPCDDDTAEIIVNVTASPDAGLDSNITLCNSDNAINLFSSIAGTPDTGGTWTPALTSGSNIFDPSVDAQGTYTYTVNFIGCAPVSSEIVVTINTLGNPGQDGEISICKTDDAIDLFTVLNSTPDTGGNWTPALSSGNGIFDPSIDTAGTYTYTINGIAPCPDVTANVIVTIYDDLILFEPDMLKACDVGNDATELFDLEQQTSIITAANLNYNVTYHLSQVDADTGMNPLISPYANIANPQTIYSRVVNTNTGCFDSSINFDIELEETVIANSDTYEICDDNVELDGDPTNDTNSFDLNSRDAIILGPAQAPADFNVSYYLTQNEADNSINPLSSPYSNIINTQTIFARVDNTINSCFATSEVLLRVNPLPVFSLDDSYTICFDENGILVNDPPTIIDTGLNTNNYSFEWFLNGVLIIGQVNGSIIPLQPGDYSVIVTDNTTNCNSNANTVVVESAPPILVAQQISITFIEDNTILATATNSSPSINTTFEFSLDGGPWVSNTPNDGTYTFENVSPGQHTITARDINGCGETETTILIIDFIPYFTPNDDGFHDTWNILGIENQPDAVIYIFNRYGKLLKQLSPTGNGWDGTYNNNNLPTSDYWFTVEYNEPTTNERKTFKSHFTLKR